MFDQQPIGSLAAELIAMHTHQHPTAFELCAFQREFKVACKEGLVRGLGALGSPEAAVPQHDRAAAVLALRDRALEITVVERMILDFHGQTFVGGIQRRSAGNRPGLEHTLPFQAHIVVQLPGGMLLHDEAQARGGCYALLARGLLGFREVALGAINGERRLRHLMRLDPSFADRRAGAGAMPWDLWRVHTSARD